MVTTVTTDMFQDFISASDKPVIIDFWAEWCGPCRAFSGVIDQLAEEYAGKILVGKVNVDEESKLADQFHVMSIPTVAIFLGGELKETFVGSRGYDDLVAAAEMYLI
jgi:thioredoxin 1